MQEGDCSRAGWRAGCHNGQGQDGSARGGEQLRAVDTTAFDSAGTGEQRALRRNEIHLPLWRFLGHLL